MLLASLCFTSFRTILRDRSAAWFKIHEVEGSNPKKWMVEVDPELVRWRELSRDRARERVDGDNTNDDETEMVE